MHKNLVFLLLLTSLQTFAQDTKYPNDAALIQEKGILTPELLWKLGRVYEPRLSPDGKTVIYAIRTFNVPENSGNTDIWILNLANNQSKPLLTDPADESNARWRPDGKKITFLAPDKNKIAQIWEINPDGTGKIQVTNNLTDISNYGYAPALNNIWYTASVKLDKQAVDLYPDLPKATGKIYDDLMYRHWNAWSDGTYSHIFVTGYADGKITGTPKDIMTDERFDSPMKPMGGDEQIAISPDGKTIAYTCKKFSGTLYAVSTNSEIYLCDIVSNTTTNISAGMPGYDKNPRFSPDGKKILWLSMATPGYEADRNRIFTLDFSTKIKTELTEEFDYSVESADWSNDGKTIYFLCGINATDQLWSLDATPGAKKPAIRQITHDVGDYTDFSSAMDGKNTVMITCMMAVARPAEIFSINLKDGSSTQITFTNKDVLNTIQMGKVEKRMVKATDGKDILTWVIYPPGFDPSKKYPALLYCQGGPQSTVSQFFSYRWNFQLMAANGYIIVAPNRRGLPSFGTEWNRQISGDWGGQNMKDYLSAIDEVSKEPYVNKDKLGSVGASYGGYSVYWLAGHHEKRFKAFIAHCGVFDLKSMYGTTEELWFPDFDLGGPYWKNPMPESYKKFSPSDYIQNWDTPMLVVHNEKDFRVPLGQGMEAFTAARLQNIPARFLYFPDEGHWVNKPQNSILWQRVFFDWLDKYLK
ncbi:MAG TPA: S9 family peptidase [Bacteroidia bacterium]|nr:S9 family peptidase [Bacteroidia bacterium]